MDSAKWDRAQLDKAKWDKALTRNDRKRATIGAWSEIGHRCAAGPAGRPIDQYDSSTTPKR